MPARSSPATVRLDNRFYWSPRKPWSLDHAWRLCEEHLPTGWALAELLHMTGTTWYASASQPEKPAGEHLEATGSTPVRALLGLARELHARKHRPGRPPIEYVPPAPRRARDRSGGYRSPAIDTVAMLGD